MLILSTTPGVHAPLPSWCVLGPVPSAHRETPPTGMGGAQRPRLLSTLLTAEFPIPLSSPGTWKMLCVFSLNLARPHHEFCMISSHSHRNPTAVGAFFISTVKWADCQYGEVANSLALGAPVANEELGKTPISWLAAWILIQHK